MKCNKKRFVLVCVLVLLFSFAATAYATTGPYYYDFVNVDEVDFRTDVTINNGTHYEGIENTIRYSYPSSIVYFDFSQFRDDHRSGLKQAYLDNGWKSSMRIAGGQGSYTISADMPDATYLFVLLRTFREGTWRVKIFDTPTYSGLFEGSPVDYILVMDIM